MRADLRLAWLLTNGSDRREWWRIGLTAVGAACVAVFGAMASAVASVRGYSSRAMGKHRDPGADVGR